MILYHLIVKGINTSTYDNGKLSVPNSNPKIDIIQNSVPLDAIY